MDSNNTNFPAELAEILKKVPKKNDDGFYYHQRVTYVYAMKATDRGMMISYEPGYGKSRIAAAWAEMGLEQGWEPVILATKTLHDNFRKGLFEYRKTLPKFQKEDDVLVKADINRMYEFISSNASNMADQVERTVQNKELDDKLGTMMGTIQSLEGKMIVIDEAHNLFNAITNGSKNALRLYNMIMKTKKIKLIFLTATPIINEPFELVPCMNMLEGTIQGQTLFPEDWSEFYKYFVDMEHLKIKNKDKFQNRILGKVSYYGSIYEGSPKSQTGRKDVISRKDFPDELHTIVESVPMSREQFAQYIIAEDTEKRQSSKVYGMKAKVPLQKPGIISSSTYRVETRQISNYAFPKYVPKKAPPQTKASLIKEEDIRKLKEFSPKLDLVKTNVKKYKKNIIYSQFLNGTLRVLQRNMETDGWTKWDGIKKGKGRCYSEISGDIPEEERTAILKVFNDKNNMYGELINDLFITAAGSEGLDTKDVDAVHQLEPYWNPSRDVQVRARAIRLKSHERRPAKDRIVQPYLYLSVPPVGSDRVELTTDQQLHTKSENASKLNQSFFYALVEASIDCIVHSNEVRDFDKKDLKCVMCQPTGKKLHGKFNEDMILSSPCKPYKEETVKVKSIKIGDEKYFYNLDDGLEVYKYDPNLDVYSPIDESSDEYRIISDKI